ncbi:MFS transporter [Allobaculum stercoricanis]|uniref:MFS transporter n=1 Tax=Allobaculum stercoricanis TaxID=174709 RepID=UPI0023F2BE90|nr:MFS transporter [Allobaculum stercoricanis]
MEEKTNSRKKLMSNGTRNIILLGLISCFADISSEMVYPLIPLYLTAVFGATPVLVGLIEGIAESIASLLKVFSGYISDRFQHKKAIAFSGYATGLLYKIALIFATSWNGILSARVIDRFGKGIRTAPRDVMVSESADQNNMGKSFGIHKMLDMAGSAIGILLSFILLKKIGSNPESYKTIFAISMIPIVIALLLFFFVHEKKEKREPMQREYFWKNISQLDHRLKLYLIITFLFTLGNSSNSFLLLRAYDIGFDSSTTILLYFVYNLTASLLAIPCGKLSDKIGRKHLLVGGYLTFSLVYFGFAFCTSKPLMILIFVVYGIYTAMTAGAERAFIAEIAPIKLKGTMLGLHSTLVGIALLPASVIAGFLWDKIDVFAPFMFGGILSLIAALLLATKMRSSNQ